jgi:hypothetical protein
MSILSVFFRLQRTISKSCWTLIDLFRPKWKHRDIYSRKAAVIELSNQEILAHVARNDRAADVRLVAAKKLADRVLAQSVFAELAGNLYLYHYLRKEAADQLTDRVLAQSFYAQMAHHDAEQNKKWEREKEQKEWDRAEREGNCCRNHFLADPEEWCDFCRTFKHTGKCLVCGKVVRHICT